MSTPESLQDLYIDELKDLWSANDQMQRVIGQITEKASSPRLKSLLQKSEQRIGEHTEQLKQLIESNDESLSKEHCKGMEGLVAEARKHILEEAPREDGLLDAVIIAQYQRMTHYGIAGFGTAAAYADALGLEEDAQMLRQTTGEIYNGDEYATTLAETSVNLEASDE